MVIKHTVALEPQYDVDTAPLARISRVARRSRYMLDIRLERFGITGVQWGVLGRLHDHDGLSQSEIQQAMGIEGATLTSIVQRLERDGWIRRTSGLTDRRSRRVWLTDKSRAALPEIAAEVDRHREQLKRGLSETDLGELVRLLSQIEENLL